MLRLKKHQGHTGSGRLPAAGSGPGNATAEAELCKHWNDADADRLAKRLRKYQHQLTTFLHYAAVEGTNNAAERAFRPMVLMQRSAVAAAARKVAKACAVLASVMRTMPQQRLPLVHAIQTLLRVAYARQDANLPTELFHTS